MRSSAVDPAAIGGRLKEFRLALGLTSREFAASVDQHQASFSMVEGGRNLFSMATLALLVERYGLNANWLLTGYGEMKLKPLVNGRPLEGPMDQESAYPMVRVPILSSFLSLGEPVPQGRERVKDFAEIIKPLVPHPRHTYGLKARGDSMAPVINDRWLVLVDIHPDALRPYERLHGKAVVVQLGEGASIKWFEAGKKTWTIYAENKASGFQTLRIPRQVDPPLLGLVTWWCPSL